jgi:hypothetical protein
MNPRASPRATARSLLERIADALDKLSAPAEPSETVDVEGAAVLLHTTKRAIYERRRRGQMPPPVRGAKRLVWRKVDLLRRGP